MLWNVSIHVTNCKEAQEHVEGQRSVTTPQGDTGTFWSAKTEDIPNVPHPTLLCGQLGYLYPAAGSFTCLC